MVPSGNGKLKTGKPNLNGNKILVDGAGEEAGSDRNADPKNDGTHTVTGKAPTETAEFVVYHIVRDVEVNGEKR